ncbi:hypothetical protein GCM10010156_73090 [Planobispora rosea]|uniref:Uncharacterized protein n=1 Tax=Planobispora rosea TaxID=35762 RepID=A0A8J3WG50_PLARO|nr:hypothetical protein [Planobispora rosea]GGT04654.1 hypothetical protein GCM10010156_73090 [Planobispora rosea]GIH88879.1 hypothetical protein Pro02_72870 [Planobispora rosea]
MARLSSTPPQPDSYLPGDRVWAVPEESPATDQSAYLARIVEPCGPGHSYRICFTDRAMPARWKRDQVAPYEGLELLA